MGRKASKGIIDAHVSEWVKWRDDGVEEKPWSKTYKAKSVYYLNRFFREDYDHSFSLVNNLKIKLTSIDPLRVTLRRHYYAPVASYCKYLLSIGRLSREDLLAVREMYPKKPPAYQPKQLIITEETCKDAQKAAVRIIDGFDGRTLRNVLVVMSEAGLRAEEVVSLKVEDVVLTPSVSYIHVRNGKGGKPRKVPISTQTAEIMATYLRERAEIMKPHETSLYISCWKYRPITYTWLKKWIPRLSAELKVPFTAHSFRHLCITKWANNPKLPIATVSRWAGHSSIMITQRYIHVEDLELAKLLG